MGVRPPLVASFALSLRALGALTATATGCAIETESRAVATDGAARSASGGVGGGASGASGAAAGVEGGGRAGAEMGGARQGGTTAGGDAGAAGSVTGGTAGNAGGGAAGLAGTGGSAGSAGESGAAGSGGDPCVNGVADAGETDIDCGKVCLLRCALGQNCAEGADCASSFCDGQRCVASQCLDGKQNGSEADVDCGGACPPCALDKTCFADADCAAGLACANGLCRTTGRSCRDIQKRDPKATDGDYVIDADGEASLPPRRVRCDMTKDGGGWTAVLRAQGPYTPTSVAVGDLTKTGDPLAKLADAYINVLAPDNRTFRVVGNVGVKSLYFTTSARFVDTAPSWGVTAAPLGLVCESESLATCTSRQVFWGSLPYNWIDTLYSKHSGDDCERYFIDLLGAVGCYQKPAGQRCVAAGGACSQGPYANRDFTLWQREWAPDEGLLASYAFEEGSGDDTKDVTGHGLDGALVGDAGARPLWTNAGHRGGGLTFEGNKHTHVRVPFPGVAAGKIPSGEQLYLPTSNTTFSLWYRAPSAPVTSYRFLATTDDGSGIDRTLDILPGNVLLQAYVVNRPVRTLAGTNTSDGLWHHVAWSFDAASGIALYLDGKSIDVVPEKVGCGAGCSDFNAATRLLVGSPPHTNDGLTGSIDDVQLYQIPLTKAEVETLYAAQK